MTENFDAFIDMLGPLSDEELFSENDELEGSDAYETTE
jgi:hypothetical protein